MNQDVWNDTKRWLENSIKYLEDYKNNYIHNKFEYSRLKGKVEGLKVCLEHMKESERIYQSEKLQHLNSELLDREI